MDKAATIAETGVFKHLSWTECTSWGQEGLGKRNVTAVADLGANLRLGLRPKRTLQRGGPALDQADTMTFSPHEGSVNHVCVELQREPLPGYAAVAVREKGTL